MSEKEVVLTMYGRGSLLEDISITLFERGENYYYRDDTSAVRYCKTINKLKLQDDEWIHARVIKQNKKISFKKPEGIQFEDIIKKLDKEEMWMIAETIPDSIFATALKGEIIKDTIFNQYLQNPSRIEKEKYWVKHFFEIYEAAEIASEADIIAAREKVVEEIERMVMYGRIEINEE